MLKSVLLVLALATAFACAHNLDSGKDARRSQKLSINTYCQHSIATCSFLLRHARCDVQ